MATISTALPGRYAKFLTAAAGIGIVYAQNHYGANQWVQLAVAVAAALGVLAVPNTPAAPVLPVAELIAQPIIPFKGDISEEYVAALKAALANVTGTPSSVTPPTLSGTKITAAMPEPPPVT